jgi:hypothetical protein
LKITVSARKCVFHRLAGRRFERHLSIIHRMMIDGVMHGPAYAENLSPGLSVSGQVNQEAEKDEKQ